MLLRHLLSSTVLGFSIVFAGPAATSPVVGGGLTDLYACPDGTSCSPASADYTLYEPYTSGAYGSVSISGGTASIDLFVDQIFMNDTSPSLLGHFFLDMRYEVDIPVSVLDLGGGSLQIDQSSYQETGVVSGSSDTIGVPPYGYFIDASVAFKNLSCLLQDGAGQCSFDVGDSFFGDLDRPIDGVTYDFYQSFAVMVPEPGTFALVGLGLVGLAARRR